MEFGSYLGRKMTIDAAEVHKQGLACSDIYANDEDTFQVEITQTLA